MIGGTLAITLVLPSTASFAASKVKQYIETMFTASYARYEAKLLGRIVSTSGGLVQRTAKFLGKIFVIARSRLGDNLCEIDPRLILA
jgi:hypothetical protein